MLLGEDHRGIVVVGGMEYPSRKEWPSRLFFRQRLDELSNLKSDGELVVKNRQICDLNCSLISLRFLTK